MPGHSHSHSHTHSHTPAELPGRVRDLMPEVLEELATLVALPSVAFPGFPADPVLKAAEATAELLRRSGAPDARLLDIPDG